MSLGDSIIALKTLALKTCQIGLVSAVTLTAATSLNVIDEAVFEPLETAEKPSEITLHAPYEQNTTEAPLFGLPLDLETAPHSFTPRVKPEIEASVLVASARPVLRPHRSKKAIVPRSPRNTRIQRIPNRQIPAPRDRSPVISNRKLFGSVEIKFDDEKKIKAWGGTYNRFVADVDHLSRCLNSDAYCQGSNLDMWAKDLRSLKNKPLPVKLAEINHRVNQKRHMNDTAVYGRSDYWASPQEFLAMSGDCEDFALMKFASLLALGVENEDMRLVVGTLADGTPHAFLAVNSGGAEYVMDNRNARVIAASSRLGYIPKYSMNLTDRWSHVMPQTRMTS